MLIQWVWRLMMAGLFAATATVAIAEEAPGALRFGTENFVPADIVDARAQPELDGHVALLITLEEPASARLAALTKDNEIAAPIIVEPITGGSFQISGSFTMEEARQLALDISGKPPLADSLEDE
jgi:hypothetical protein